MPRTRLKAVLSANGLPYPTCRATAATVAAGEWPNIAPVSPRQKSTYRCPSTSVIVAPRASFMKSGYGPAHSIIQFIGTPPILAFRASDAILAFVNGKDVTRYARTGVITPDHVIRTKPWPLIVPAPEAGSLDAFKQAAHAAAQKFADDYKAYFNRNKARAPNAVMHDPMPRVVLVPGLGLFGLGDSAQDAKIAADIADARIDGRVDLHLLAVLVADHMGVVHRRDVHRIAAGDRLADHITSDAISLGVERGDAGIEIDLAVEDLAAAAS